MIATDTTTLSDIIVQCFDYSMDGRFTQKQRSAFLTDGKRLRGPAKAAAKKRALCTRALHDLDTWLSGPLPAAAE